jgi:hypothetical protein
MDTPDRIWLDKFWTEERTGGHFRCTRHQMNTGGGGDIEYVRADAYAAKLAEIRAAVEAERGLADNTIRASERSYNAHSCAYRDGRAALDALLAVARG